MYIKQTQKNKKEGKNTMIIKGFITNLGKYNEGELIGKWIEFPVSDDDLQEVLKKINCCYYDEDGEYINTGYEEFFFTDWETGFNDNFGEYENIDDINKIAEALEKWDEKLFIAACEVWNVDEVLDSDPDDYYLCSNITSDYDLGEYYAVECCCIDFKNNPTLERYFDFEAFGRDIRFDSNGGFTEYGWIERY
jgi:antirestriction protein